MSGVVFARKPKHMHGAARAKRPVMRPEARPVRPDREPLRVLPRGALRG